MKRKVLTMKELFEDSMQQYHWLDKKCCFSKTNNETYTKNPNKCMALNSLRIKSFVFQCKTYKVSKSCSNSLFQKQAMLVRQLEEEVVKTRQHAKETNPEIKAHIESLQLENDHLTREVAILKETIKVS